jgi:uncharacterized protein DUF3313
MTKVTRISIFALFLTGLLVLTMFGCAGPQAAKTGFMKDYSQLQPHPEIEGRHRYINPHVDASKYNKFIVDPVAINLSPKGKERDIDPKDLDKLAKFFRKKIGEELSKGYQITGSPGPDVARVRTSISEVNKTLPYLNVHPGTKLTGAGLGGAGAEMELVDSQSGQRIAAAIDNQKGSRMDITGGLTWYGNAEGVMENWAKDLKKWVDKVHGKPVK